MTEILRKISVDLSRRGNTRLIFARQNDRGSRALRIKLTDGGLPYFVPKGTVATVNILRADGASAAFQCDVTDEGEVGLTLGLWALSVSGEARCSVSLYGGDDMKLTSADFVLDVQDELYSGEDIAEDEGYSLLTSLLSSVAEVGAEEEKRIDAEKSRVTAELLRVKAEADRADAESYRREADDIRAMNDSQFARNEALRMVADEERSEAEKTRVASEESRIASEETRIAAEASREDAERLRASAEEARAEAEGLREAAEEERKLQMQRLSSASNVRIADENGYFKSDAVEGALAELYLKAEEVDRKRSELMEDVETLGVRIGENSGEISSLRIDDAALRERIRGVEEQVAENIGVAGEITLPASGFEEELSCILQISGLGDYDLVSFYPASAADRDRIAECGLFILPDAQGGAVVFTADKAPTDDVSLRFFITRGISMIESEGRD